MKLLLAKFILTLFGLGFVGLILAMLIAEPIVAVILASMFAIGWAASTVFRLERR